MKFSAFLKKLSLTMADSTLLQPYSRVRKYKRIPQRQHNYKEHYDSIVLQQTTAATVLGKNFGDAQPQYLHEMVKNSPTKTCTLELLALCLFIKKCLPFSKNTALVLPHFISLRCSGCRRGAFSGLPRLGKHSTNNSLRVLRI